MQIRVLFTPAHLQIHHQTFEYSCVCKFLQFYVLQKISNYKPTFYDRNFSTTYITQNFYGISVPSKPNLLLKNFFYKWRVYVKPKQKLSMKKDV